VAEVQCEGCGHAWSRTSFATGRIKRCKFCPPKQGEADAPDLQTQLEELLDEVWRDERRERLQDRLDLMNGPNH
jgi:hypothetical protein